MRATIRSEQMIESEQPGGATPTPPGILLVLIHFVPVWILRTKDLALYTVEMEVVISGGNTRNCHCHIRGLRLDEPDKRIGVK